MKYFNQLEYAHIPYPTDIKTPKSKFHRASVKEAGCGLCCLCMIVDQLTTENLTLKKCLQISVKSGANHEIGTDMKILAPIIAQKYNLKYETTNSLINVLKTLKNGGRVIANVGGDRPDEDHIGLFSHGGHYIALISASNREICVLDPSMKAGKYDEPGRSGIVRQCGDFVYVPTKYLELDTSNRSPRYYLFSRL